MLADRQQENPSGPPHGAGGILGKRAKGYEGSGEGEGDPPAGGGPANRPRRRTATDREPRGDGFLAGWRWAENVDEVKQEQQGDKRSEGVRPDAVAGTSGLRIEHRPESEDRTFHEDRPPRVSSRGPGRHTSSCRDKAGGRADG